MRLNEITVEESVLVRLEQLLQSDIFPLETFIGEITESDTLDETDISVHFRFIKPDANGRPMVKRLAEAMLHHLSFYVTPRSRINESEEKDEKQKRILTCQIHEEAKRLFVKNSNTGEGGEFLLYLIAEKFLKLPQVLCKMPFKTSGNVHIHGTDGIHVKYEAEQGVLALYWGESKLHATVNSAIDECFESVAPFLLEEGTGDDKQGRDLQLFRDNAESHVDDPELAKALLEYIDPKHVNYSKCEYRAICLIGFDSASYPSESNLKNAIQLKQEFLNEVAEWRKKLIKSIRKHKISSFTIEAFCLPFPSVQGFRDSFLEILGVSAVSSSSKKRKVKTLKKPSKKTPK